MCEEETKFQVGDIVRCVSGGFNFIEKGELYKVGNMASSNILYIKGIGDYSTKHFKLYKRPTFKMGEEVMYEGKKTKVVGCDGEDDDRSCYLVIDEEGESYWEHIRYQLPEYKDEKTSRAKASELTRLEDSGEAIILTADNVLESIEKLKEYDEKHDKKYPKQEPIPSTFLGEVCGMPIYLNKSLTGAEVSKIYNSGNRLDTTFNPLQPTKMTKIDKHLKAKYFTDELIEETAELIEQATKIEDSLLQLSVNVDRIISKVRDRIHDIKESVEDDDIENHRTELLELKSALKDLGSKDITTLLAISAKWTPKKETTIKSILPNQE